MLDHLDDHDPPVPGEDLRGRVGARARQRRQRRQAVVGTAGAVVAVGVLLAGLGLSGAGTDARPDTQFATPGPSASATSPSATPSPGTAPGPGTGAGGVTTGTGSGCARTPQLDCADGTPGYLGAQSCFVRARPFGPASREVVPGLAASLEVSSAAVGASAFTGSVTFTSTAATTVTITYAPYSFGGLVVIGGEFSRELGADETVTVEPGGSRTVGLVGSTRTCGDTQAQGLVPLPGGSYDAGAYLLLRSVETAPAGGVVEPAGLVATGGLAGQDPSSSPSTSPSASLSAPPTGEPSAVPEEPPGTRLATDQDLSLGAPLVLG